MGDPWYDERPLVSKLVHNISSIRQGSKCGGDLHYHLIF